MASRETAAEVGLQQAVVKSAPTDDNLQIALVLAGKRRLMDRPKSEALQKTLARMQKNAMPAPDKKQKRPKGQAAPKEKPEEALTVVLFEDERQLQPVNPDLQNLEAWRPGRVLQIGETKFSIIYNPPTAEKVQIYGRPLTGCPIVASAMVTFAPEDDCQWQWFRGGSAWNTGTRPENQPQQSRPAAGTTESSSVLHGAVTRTYASDQWQAIQGACSPLYIPTAEDVGLKLRVRCTPARASSLEEGPAATGEPMFAETNSTVTEGPAQPAAAARQRSTRSVLSAPAFRAVTYNILADQYASSEHAQTHLFAYCPTQYMDASYRRPLIAQEVLGYKADIVCLQEVDEKAFSTYFLPVMKHAGFEGFYTNKAGKTAEGAATFFRRERYRAVAVKELSMNKLFADILADPSAHRLHSQFLPLLQSSPVLVQALSRVTTVAQLTVLQPVSCQPGCEDGPLCLVNTHLFFHPQAPHIRTLHVAAMLAEAQALAESAATELGSTPALLFCGDLNSDLNDGMPGALELLQSGELSAEHWDWECGAGFSFTRDEGIQENGSAKASNKKGNGEQAESTGENKIHGVHLRAPIRLRSADDLQYAFSNYVRGYTGLLDYIWYDPERLEVQEPLPLPSAEELQGWIPSARFPSDHLSLVFDFTWRPNRQSEAAPSTGNAIKSDTQNAPASTAKSREAGTVSSINVSDREQNGASLPAALGNGNSGKASGQGTSAEDITLQHASHAGTQAQQELQAVAGCSGQSAPLASSASAAGSGSGLRAEGRSHAAQGVVIPADEEHMAEAAAALGRGKIVALPTDTLYGLAACANSQQGMERIYAVKHRQLHVPLAICVSDVEDVARFGSSGHLPDGLLSALLPGAVTVILTRLHGAPLCAALNPGISSIGIRVPDSDFIRGVCRAHGGAIVLTSANLSGGASPTQVTDFEELWPLCAAVFDAGALGSDRAGSTIIDLSRRGSFRVVREGSEPERVRQVLTEEFSLTEQSQ